MLHSTLVLTESVAADARTRLRSAKAAFTTRRVARDAFASLSSDRCPNPGDLVLAVVDSIGQHDGLQLASGRRARIHEGDEILLCYGNRYATSQWEAVVPPSLEACDLVAAGGVAGKVRSRHASAQHPTRLLPVGLAANDRGVPLNLRDHALPAREELPQELAPMAGVVGTSMDGGKTTAACALIRGLARKGRRVAGIKLTGTGACGDYFQMLDAGAAVVADFTDAGFVSTYRSSTEELLRILCTLVGHAMAEGADVIVAEIADGVAQGETAALLASECFHRAARVLLLAAGDALGAQAAVARLVAVGLAPAAITGLASISMLTALETRELTGLPVLGLAELEQGNE